MVLCEREELDGVTTLLVLTLALDNGLALGGLGGRFLGGLGFLGRGLLVFGGGGLEVEEIAVEGELASVIIMYRIL